MSRFVRFSMPRTAAACVVLAAFSGVDATAEAGELASAWVEGHNVRTRLVVGVGNGPMLDAANPGKPLILAGLEMELAEGWKTYWRTPGDAGGVPPEFSFSGSTNVEKTIVLYPAPRRYSDRAGSTIGYKKRVVFPVYVQPTNPDAAVTVKLQLAFGVCMDICVPSEGSYEVTLPVAGRQPVPAALAEAIKRVPGDPGLGLQGQASKVATMPRLLKVETASEASPHKVMLFVAFPSGTAGADVFVEGPPGEFVPMTKVVGNASDNTITFEIDLSKGADVAALKGQTLKATMVSDGGQSEQEFVLK